MTKLKKEGCSKKKKKEGCRKKKKIEDTKKSQMEILEVKNTVSEFL